ncbi:MAG: hypothetical protein R3C69_05400 [Geminicoccaceae bacterium]
MDGQSILKAAKNELDGALAGGTVTAADSKVPVQGGSALAGDGDAGGIKPIVGGGTMASVSGTGAGSAGAFASQTIASTADGKGAPIVTTSTGGLSTGGFSGSGFAVAPTTTPATTPATAPTTASLGTLTPMSLLGGFSMPTMPSFSVGSGG